MESEFYATLLGWLAIGAATGWAAAPLMRFRGKLVIFSMVVGMGGALLGGMLITMLMMAATGDGSGADPGALLFVFACAGMMLTTIPKSRYGARHHHHHRLQESIEAYPRSHGNA